MAVERRYHLIVATALWGTPGVIVTIKGVGTYTQVMQSQLWWLLIVTVGVGAGFYYIFRKITRRYIERIASLPAKSSWWQTFPPKGWLLIVFMMCLGVTLRFFPAVPIEFTASFYSALGPMLLAASLRFLSATSRP